MMNRTDLADCLIIAAGRGSRLAAYGQPKPLVRLGAFTLIERVLRTASVAGLRRFVVVTGFMGEKIEQSVHASPLPDGADVSIVHNPAWQQPNGISVRCAAPVLGDRFVLLMSDHLFDAGILSSLRAAPMDDDEVLLAVDTRIEHHPTVDLDDVTRVRVEDGFIRDIGKGIANYNAFDTGIFICSRALFDALDRSFGEGDYTLSGGIRELAACGKARTLDIGTAAWVDVDDAAAYRHAARLFAPESPDFDPLTATERQGRL